MGIEYTCYRCRVKFESGWSDDKAKQEYQASSFYLGDDADTEVLCDDCYRKFKKWFNSQQYERRD